MKRALFTASVMLAAAAPAAQASVTKHHARQYRQAYQTVSHKFGHRAPGRNIIKWGTRYGPLTDAAVLSSIAVLDRMLAPPPTPPVPQAVIASPTVTSTPSYSSSGSMPTCTWLPESGGNWNAVNSSSGAGGRYQIMPSTWAANGGTGSPQSASPAEQNRVAQNVLHSQGLGAWVNC